MKRKFHFFIITFILVLFAGAVLAYGLWTTHGSGILTRRFIDRWGGDYADASVGQITGNMVQGLKLSKLTLRNLKNFPPGSVLEVESLFINISSLNIEDVVVEIENARLKLPSSGSIFLFGAMRKGILDFNLYSNNVDAREVLKLFPNKPKSFQFVRGYLSNVDINIKGIYKKPVFIGQFFVDKIFYKEDFVLSESSGRGHLSIERRDGNINLLGPLSFKSGDVLAKKIHAHLEDSKVIFTGLPKNPVLNLYGYSMIEDLKVNIRIEGTRERPDIELSSNPSFSETNLLLMLVTGKRWTGLDESITQGAISPDLARDAVDYFIFGGSGGRIANSLGIKDVSISYDQEKGTKGIALKKDVTKQIEVGYGLEQEQVDPAGPSTVIQKLGGEIKMTDKISVGVEREFIKHYDPQLSSPDALPQETDDKLLLKYKGKF